MLMVAHMTMLRPKRQTRRDQILLFIAEYAVDHQGNSPSLGEIAMKFEISRQAVYVHTLKLVGEGRARWQDNKLCLTGAEYTPPLTDVN